MATIYEEIKSDIRQLLETYLGSLLFISEDELDDLLKDIMELISKVVKDR